MTELSTKQPAKIRTFAGDLDKARKQREELEKSKKVTPPPSKPQETIPSREADSIHISTPATVIEKTVKPIIVNKKLPDVNIVVPKQITENKTAVKTQIPSFHELQKQISAIHQNSTNHETANSTTPKIEVDTLSKVIVSDQVNPKNPLNISLASTVITDTKSNNFNFFTSIIKSLQDWFKKQSRDNKKKKAREYSVPETQRRKGVIQKATSKTATAFTSGSGSIRDQIKRRSLQETNTKSHAPETIWSPFTDSGYPLLEAPDTIQNVTVEYKKIPPPINKVAEIKVPNPLPPVELVIPTKVVTVVEEPNIITPPVEAVIDEVKDLPLPDINVDDETNYEERWVDPETSNPPEPIVVDVISDNEPVALIKMNDIKINDNNSLLTLLSQFISNTVLVIMLITVISLISIISVSRFVTEQIKIRHESELSNPIYTAKQIVANSTVVPVVLTTQNINDLPKLIYSTIASTSAGVVELALLAPDGTELSGSYIFDLLHFRAIPNLRQSITAVRFISTNHGTPAILLQFVDKDNVRGGLLKWESTILIDVFSLYKTPRDSEALFEDSLVDGKAVRLLSSGNDPILLYGFISENTVVITNNTRDFEQVAKQELRD